MLKFFADIKTNGQKDRAKTTCSRSMWAYEKTLIISSTSIGTCNGHSTKYADFKI